MIINLSQQGLNELASTWFCLSELRKKPLSENEAIKVIAKQHQTILQLIPMLKAINAAKGNPFETYLEGDVFVNIWLSEDQQIQDSGYYCRPAQ